MEPVRIKQNNEALYHAASLLKDLNEQVVYVGGRIVGLLITDIVEDDVRPTFDICWRRTKSAGIWRSYMSKLNTAC